MPIDADKVMDIFTALGEALSKPTTLCLIGSTPGIATGQPDRQTPDMDVWFAKSRFDSSDLSRACKAAGVLFDPRGEMKGDEIYLQIVRPGVVNLPSDFTPEAIGNFGNLTLVMPPPEILVAAKLVRASEIDINDIVWWVRQRGMDVSDIQVAIDSMPNPRDRETATENIVIVQVLTSRQPR